MPPVVTFNHNLRNPSGVMDAYISIAATSTAINERQLLADDIKNYIQGPPNARYSAEQIDQNIKELSRLYIEKYDASEKGQYKVKRLVSSEVTKYGLTIDNDKIGQSISNAIDFLDPKTFYELLEDDQAFNFDDELTKYIITPDNATPQQKEEIEKAADGDPVQQEQEKIEEQQEKLVDLAEEAQKGIKFLENLPLPYFVNDDYKTELGTIGNIFINLKMLHQMVLDENLEGQDKKEKKEIALYDFIKNVMTRVANATGNVNTFDVFVEPNGNAARIIDINYVDKEEAEKVYEKAFQLEIHNLKSIVRSYKLESKIFPDQSAQVAIGAQVEGGTLGTDTTSLVSFNRGIIDRIIPDKTPPPAVKTKEQSDIKNRIDALLSNIETLYEYFGRLTSGYFVDSDFDADKSNGYANALRDLINYLKAISKTKTSNKAIIPTGLSIELDGIGGLIIGNLFKVNTDILPKGYKGSGQGGVGPNVGYLITGLGHNVENGDWVTKIDTQTIILDPPSELYGKDYIDYSNITVNLNATTEKEIIQSSGGGGSTNGGSSSPPAPSGVGSGKKALVPDISSIRDSELDIVKGPFTSNTGTVQELAVVDGKPVGKDVAKAIILMKRAAAKDKIDLRVNSGFRSPYTAINAISTKGTKVQASAQDTLYASYKATGKPLTAKPGTSNHGNAFAFDLNTGSATGAIKSPLNKPVYQWLITNAYKFGFVRWVAKEEWHWEYRPGEYQYNERVPKNNRLYAGMRLDD